jgi:hypothetical protein
VQLEDWLRRRLGSSTTRPAQPADPRTTLYLQAVEALIADKKKPTDALVAERLDKDARTIRRWRQRGLIP